MRLTRRLPMFAAIALTIAVPNARAAETTTTLEQLVPDEGLVLGCVS